MRELEKVTVSRLQVPLSKPYWLSFGTVEHYDTIVVELIDRDGGCGLGGATGFTGYTDETIEDGRRAACGFAPGMRPRRAEQVPSALADGCDPGKVQ